MYAIVINKEQKSISGVTQLTQVKLDISSTKSNKNYE